MMQSKKVSVIIPVFNTAAYLPQCLDSVLGQSLKDIEVICVNDGSTDNSQNIMEEYAKRDGRLSVISASGRGPGFARNLALDQAKGDYVSFVDSDDYIHPDMLSEMYTLVADDSVDIAFCAFKKFNANPTELFANCNYNKIIPNSLDDVNFTWVDIQKILFDLRFAACNKIYRRGFLVENHIGFSVDIFYEDMIFTYKAFLCAKSMRLIRKRFYFNRRQRPGATTFMQGDQVLGLFTALNDLEAFLDTNNDFNILRDQFEAFKFDILIKNMHKNDAAHVEVFYERLRDYVISKPELLINPNLSKKQAMLADKVRQCDFLNFIMYEYWVTKNAAAALKRVNRKLNKKNDKLSYRTTNLEKKNKKLNSKIKTLKRKIGSLERERDKTLSSIIKNKLSKITRG